MLAAWWVGSLSAHAQVVRRQVLKAAAAAPTRLVFYQVEPVAVRARGVLVLLPGRGEAARHVLRATKLGQEAARRGLVVLVPELNNQIRLTDASRQLLDGVLDQATRQRPALRKHVVLGGFSAGGQLALAYAEGLVRDSAQQHGQVRAVLGVDPPLDLAEHWQRAQYHVARQDCPALLAGDQRIVAELTQAMGGSPAQAPAAYLIGSAFSNSDPAGGNARWLRALPVRVYCEPDLAFWQQHYCPALRAADLNAASASAFIACLQRQGNVRASYIQTTGRGFAGRHRMPHSWTIVEAAECADWLAACLE